MLKGHNIRRLRTTALERIKVSLPRTLGTDSGDPEAHVTVTWVETCPPPSGPCPVWEVDAGAYVCLSLGSSVLGLGNPAS